MIKTKVLNEINKSYLEIIGDKGNSKDYRLKMLESNNVSCFLLKTVRCVNGAEKEYYDITGKESLLSFFNLRVADRTELEKLFLAMSQAAEEAEKLLIEEGNILLRPDCIFINSVTLSYEFICLPSDDPAESLKDNMQSLLQFFLSKLDENDIPLLKTVYSLFDRQQTSVLGSRILYDLFVDGINRDEKPSLPVLQEKTISEEDKDVDESEYTVYFPSFKELAIIFLLVAGTALIGYEAYITMIAGL